MNTKEFILLNSFYRVERNLFLKIIASGIFLIFLLVLSSCNITKSDNADRWVGTWGTAPQLVEARNMPPEPGLSNNTIRQVVRVSIGGDSLRVKFSNEFSLSPVTMRSVRIALSTLNGGIDESSSKELKFKGIPLVTMEAGGKITSDPIFFKVKDREDIAVSIYFGETSPSITGHPGSRTTSYILGGNAVESVDMEGSVPSDHWYVINGIDVKAPASTASIAILGNSITDGRGSGTNKQNRWPDILSESLLANSSGRKVGVLNMGIGGNCVLKPCLGPSALERFDRDVLMQEGVKWLIILEGVNDIGGTQDSLSADRVAEELIAAFESMIVDAHANGILAYGATILPFGKSFYYTSFRESARNKVNKWIRSSGAFDAVIDFDRAMRNPEDTLTLLPYAHSGDFLHPNEEGYQMMGELIDLDLFK